MDSVIRMLEETARGFPLRTQGATWGEVEYRFVLPAQASEVDLEKARLAVGLPALPAPVETLLRQWNGPSLFQRWAPGGTFLDGLSFSSTSLMPKVGKDALRQLDDGGRMALVIADGHGCELLMEPGSDEVLIQEECVGRFFSLGLSLAEFLEAVLREGPCRQPFWADRVRGAWRLIKTAPGR